MDYALPQVGDKVRVLRNEVGASTVARVTSLGAGYRYLNPGEVIEVYKVVEIPGEDPQFASIYYQVDGIHLNYLPSHDVELVVPEISDVLTQILGV